MTCSPEEAAQRRRFEELYARAQSPVMRSIERSVCGCDYGASSWTTREEAQRIGTLLGLRPGVRLLDVGAGSGWPGLYLAKTSGCDVALVDLPLSGLRIAAQRAVADRVPAPPGSHSPMPRTCRFGTPASMPSAIATCCAV
jgi:2-polyprenyl-3-methyl-5-hydroxy-6-metoxy-1,4-benzoquinol methylase